MTNGIPTDDLNAAVAAGVIDAAQAEKLRALRQASQKPLGPDGEPVLADEERFRFLNGFNDVFLTIGVLLVAGAFLAATSTGLLGISFVGTLAFAAATFWVLSEILVGRLRAVLPGMVLSLLFVAFAASAVVVQLQWDNLSQANWDIYSELAFWRNPTLVFGLPALIAALVYYLRFRLPFTLGVIAFFGYAVVSKGLAQRTGVDPSFIALFYGLIVLVVALVYDARDTQRVTRLSDCAFWLHLVAAPLIVSPVITLIKHSTNGGSTSAIVLLTVLALGLFALAIDRRALLVSSLAYFTIAVYDILGGGIPLPQSGSAPPSFTLTLALVGGFVLILGVFWHPLRNSLLPVLKATPIGPYLPQARQ